MDKKIQSKLEALLVNAKETTIFSPSSDQRKAKNRFWVAIADKGIPEVPPEEEFALASQFAGDSRIDKWWDLAGFREWFLNSREFVQRLEYLSHVVLDTMEDILVNPDAQANARVAAGKIILEAAGKVGRKSDSDGKYADEQVQKMDRRQLEEFIRTRTRVLQAATTDQHTDTN